MTKKSLNFGLLSPVWLMSIFLASGVLLPLWPFAEGNDGFSVFWDFSYSDKGFAILMALIQYFVAFIGYVIGIKLAPTFKKSSRNMHVRSVLTKSAKIRSLIIVACGFVSLVATVFIMGGIDAWLFAGADRIRQYSGLNFLILPQNALLSISIAWFLYLNRENGSGCVKITPLLIFYTICVVSLVAVQGAKSTLFVFLFALIIIWHVRVKPLKFLMLAIIGLCTYLFLIIYHLIKQEYLVVGEFVSLNGDGTIIENFARVLFQQLTGNLMQLQTMAVLVETFPAQVPYSMGATLEMLWLIWIPSGIYLDKPLTAPGVFTNAIWPSKWEIEGTTMPPGIFGEFYMNFGVIGVFVGAIAFGLVYGLFYKKARTDCNNVNLAIYALLAAMMLHYIRGELASPTVLLVSLLFPTIWILWGFEKMTHTRR